MKASKMRDMSKEDLILEESELRKQLLRTPISSCGRPAGKRSEDERYPPGYRTHRRRS